MNITRLRRSSRAPSRLVIEIDGARFASLPEERITDLGLREGMALGEATHARLVAVADAERAYQRAVRMLAARGRASQDLLRRLRAKGHGAQAAEEAVGRLEAAGLVDDAAFAADFARMRFERGYGAGRILRELLARGVERRTAEQAVWREETEARPGAERLAALARRRLAQLGDLPPAVRKRRLAGFLARRGFGTADVLAVVRDLIPSTEGPDAGGDI